MKCAAIALALQGATGLVAPRLTVKSSALNAATLEVKSQCRSRQLSLQKRSPRASRRPKNRPAAVRMHAHCSPASAIASIAHTHPPPHPPAYTGLLETQANSSTASSAPAPRLMY